MVTYAPEYNKEVVVQQDGRISLPVIGQVMAAYKSVPELQAEISQRAASVLRNPAVTVFPGDIGPTRVMVGGEVKTPGWVDMMGDIDALQAIMAAGGFLHSAKSHQVVIIRRGRQGQDPGREHDHLGVDLVDEELVERRQVERPERPGELARHPARQGVEQVAQADPGEADQGADGRHRPVEGVMGAMFGRMEAVGQFEVMLEQAE